jgi:hypothetical protein
MNWIFLWLFVIVELSRFISIKSSLTIIKYLKLIGASIMPDKKASSELLRGNILKIVYTDEEGEKILYLPFSGQKKNWIKVSTLSISHDGLKRKKSSITKEVLKIAGPAKDFFNLPITPQMINKSYSEITFHYRKKTDNKKFLLDDVISNLP